MLLCVLRLEKFSPGAWVPWKCMKIQELSAWIYLFSSQTENYLRQIETYFGHIYILKGDKMDAVVHLLR